MQDERASGSQDGDGIGGRRPDGAATLAPLPGRRQDAPAAVRTPMAGGSDNLPAPLSSFVGREREIDEVADLLVANRLVTLVGAPGVGKTRLALRVAEETYGRYANGVRLVELAPLMDPNVVPRAVAAAFGLREAPGRPSTAALVEALQFERLLIVLDNCEHLVEACARLTVELLQSCPDVRILATSREVLAVAGEVTWHVPSLSLPVPNQAHVPERLADAEAVRLFVERARQVAPDFAVTGTNAAAVAEVCRRLDGIPLAIELAAARVKVLSPGQIAARLDDRFRLLIAGDRTALPRQRTLRGAIDWSHGLLPEKERILLRRLAVFAGSWTVEAAEVACSGDGIAADEVLDLLAQLVDKSLVLVETWGGEVRYRFLETLRQYADEALRAAGEEAALRRRHSDWCVDLAERAEVELVGPEQTAWLRRLEREHDNLRSALRWSIDAGEAETGLRLGAALWRFWMVHGHLSEGEDWLEAALSLDGGASPRARARALNAAGNLAMARGLYDPARAFHEESLPIWRELADRGSLAMALYSLGRVAHRTGDHAAARALTEESLALRRALDDRWGMAVALNMLGEIVRAQGDYVAAGPLYEEGIGLFRGAGDKRGVAIATHNLGIVARTQGNYERAAALHHVGLVLFQELGDREQIACSLIRLARLALIQGDAERAARLSGVVDAQREAIGAALLPDERADHVETVDAARSKLKEATFAAAWAAGRALSLEEAVAEAQAAPGPSSAARPVAQPRAVDGPVLRLSDREREIAALVGLGLTSRQIAERLVVSHRTVEWHVANLLGKLQLETKAQLAVWAARQGDAASSGASSR